MMAPRNATLSMVMSHRVVVGRNKNNGNILEGSICMWSSLKKPFLLKTTITLSDVMLSFSESYTGYAHARSSRLQIEPSPSKAYGTKAVVYDFKEMISKDI